MPSECSARDIGGLGSKFWSGISGEVPGIPYPSSNPSKNICATSADVVVFLGIALVRLEKLSVTTTTKQLPELFFSNGTQMFMTTNSRIRRVEIVIAVFDGIDAVSVFYSPRTFRSRNTRHGHMWPVM